MMGKSSKAKNIKKGSPHKNKSSIDSEISSGNSEDINRILQNNNKFMLESLSKLIDHKLSEFDDNRKRSAEIYYTLEDFKKKLQKRSRDSDKPDFISE